MRRILCAVAVVTLLALTTVSAAAATHHVPVKGTVNGDHYIDGPIGPGGWKFFSDGMGQMSHLGRVDYALAQSSFFGPDGSIISNGTVTFTAKNGDTLVVAQSVTSQIVEDFGGFVLAGTWEAVGGSGRFANATGSGSINGVGDIPGGDALFGLPDGGAKFTFTGDIAYDASDRAG